MKKIWQAEIPQDSMKVWFHLHLGFWFSSWGLTFFSLGLRLRLLSRRLVAVGLAGPLVLRLRLLHGRSPLFLFRGIGFRGLCLRG